MEVMGLMGRAFQQIVDNPVAEVIHAAQGAVAGLLLAYAYIRRSEFEALPMIGLAVVILTQFDIYEYLEQLDIKDPGDIDVEVDIIGAWISCVTRLIIFHVVEWRK